MTVEPNEPATSPARQVRYVASPQFAPLLAELQSSLLVTTYQAGKLVVLGTEAGNLALSFHNFETAMGLALSRRTLAVGTRRDIWFLAAQPDLAGTLTPAGRHDACLLARRAWHTGTIHAHEMAYVGDDLWIANTLFSCLCTLDERYHFVPRWKPSFITALGGPEDRCHLNGLAVDPTGVRYVTALGETDVPQGWRAQKASGGVLIDVTSDQIVTRGMAMPHSPRLHDGRLWVLDSGRGELQIVDPQTGQRTTVERLPGFCRGLSFLGPFAFVGLSKIRESNVFGGLPISEQRAELKCGVGVVDLRSGKNVASFEFSAGVDEIFDVRVAPGIRFPAVRGPHEAEDGHSPIWVVPPLPNRVGPR